MSISVLTNVPLAVNTPSSTTKSDDVPVIIGASSAPVIVTVTTCSTDSPSAVVSVTVNVSVSSSPPSKTWAVSLFRS